jgi:hypothetical protein
MIEPEHADRAARPGRARIEPPRDLRQPGQHGRIAAQRHGIGAVHCHHARRAAPALAAGDQLAQRRCHLARAGWARSMVSKPARSWSIWRTSVRMRATLSA